MTTEALGDNRDGLIVRLASVGLLLAIPLLLFRQVVTGQGVWLGNPDRLNSSLKIMLHYMRGIWTGRLDAWNDSEMLGFDSFVLPYTFPNPLNWLSATFGPEHFFVVQAWLCILLLMIAGFAAFWFLRSIRIPWPEATVGAAVYQLSALTILKLSQNDMSFAVFIVIPVGLAMIRRARAEHAVVAFAVLSIAIAAMLHFMFLQKVAYALILLSAYALYRTVKTRKLAPLFLFAGAAIVSVVLTGPRIIGIAEALGQYSRQSAGLNLADFKLMYLFQNIQPLEILRWFDGTVFGISPSDAHRLGNNINLTEGFLLSAGPSVPILLAAGIPLRFVRSGAREVYDDIRRQTDANFWFVVLLFTVSVVVFEVMNRLLFFLFLRLDFTHARILIAGLAPMCALLGALLVCLRPGGRARLPAAGLLAGLGIALMIELAARQFGAPTGPVRIDAVVRIACSLVVVSGLVVLALRASPENPGARGIAHATLASLIVAQAFVAADLQVNGPQTSNRAIPFKLSDMYMAAPVEAELPSPRQMEELRVKTGSDRVALVCQAEIAGGFCAAHIPAIWNFRSVDGYYGIGVPNRLRMLPWEGTVAGLRSISFTSKDQLPWPLLGFLNVGQALVVDETNGRVNAEPGAAITNPATVISRAFLAGSAVNVTGPSEAAARIFAKGRPPLDVRETSFVEGLPRTEALTSQLEIPVSGYGDRLQFDVASTTGTRLLVLNDLYFPGWRAFVDGIETPVLPANVVMRAVVVPPGAKQVVMTYQPFVASMTARLIYLAGIILFMVGLVIATRVQMNARRGLVPMNP